MTAATVAARVAARRMPVLRRASQAIKGRAEGEGGGVALGRPVALGRGVAGGATGAGGSGASAWGR